MKTEEARDMIRLLFYQSDEENRIAILNGLLDLVPFDVLSNIKKADDLIKKKRKNQVKEEPPK